MLHLTLRCVNLQYVTLTTGIFKDSDEHGSIVENRYHYHKPAIKQNEAAYLIAKSEVPYTYVHLNHVD